MYDWANLYILLEVRGPSGARLLVSYISFTLRKSHQQIKSKVSRVDICKHLKSIVNRNNVLKSFFWNLGCHILMTNDKAIKAL